MTRLFGVSALVAVFAALGQAAAISPVDFDPCGRYLVTDLVESATDGAVIERRTVEWELVLTPDRRYRLLMEGAETGAWRLIRGGGPGGGDAIRFDSDSGESFSARIEGDELRLLLGRNKAGHAVWLFTGPRQNIAQGNDTVARGLDELIESTAPVAGMPPLNGRHFARMEVYASSSAPVYYRKNPATGAISFDGLGALFTPSGEFYINSRYGVVESHFTGTYTVDTTGVLLTFSDGSTTNMVFADEGGTLKWYDGGVLIARYQRVVAKKQE